MTSTALVPDALLTDPFYPLLKDQLVRLTGLAYYADKDSDLARRIGHRLSILGLTDCGSYFEVLRDAQRGPAELDALIAEITIGETYFFRHAEHFEAVRDLVVPDIVRRNRATRRVRIWCAGCADGAEPYSLSILMKRDLYHLLMGWEVNILGTDINRRGLATAGKARFEEWSLRSTPEEVKRSCFLQHDKQWSLLPQYQEGVSFQYHNLVENPFPSLLNNLSAFDLIVCRNVMIYFPQDLMQRMIRQFHACLAPGAWLLVGPAEPNMTHFTSFQFVSAPGVTLYQRPGQGLPDSAADGVQQTHFVTPVLPPVPVPIAVPLDDDSEDESTPPSLADVRAYLDHGEWDGAARCCERLLETENLSSSVHFHYAMALEQLTRHDEAEQSLRRSIYLDRQYVLAHYYLGVMLLSRGRLRQAARSFENAVRLLGSRCDAGVLADGGGITAAELKKLAQTQMELIRERV